jgi:hypothetical protein
MREIESVLAIQHSQGKVEGLHNYPLPMTNSEICHPQLRKLLYPPVAAKLPYLHPSEPAQ